MNLFFKLEPDTLKVEHFNECLKFKAKNLLSTVTGGNNDNEYNSNLNFEFEMSECLAVS